MYLSTKQTINEFFTNAEISKEFHSLRNYCLYLCGGDFKAFDDYEKITSEMIANDIVTLNNLDLWNEDCLEVGMTDINTGIL